MSAAWIAAGIGGWLTVAVVTSTLLARAIRLRELHAPVMDVARHLYLVQNDEKRVS